MKIAIIGGGASGLVAAIEAARLGANVTIFEHTDKPAKKILSTGNGKCNYTNEDIQAKYFHLREEDLAYFVVKNIGYQGIQTFFETLGIEAFVRDGYTYPKSEQAASIRDALILEVKRLGILMYLNVKITKIQAKSKGFQLEVSQNNDLHRYQYDKVIMATGAKAFSSSGSDGSGLDLLLPLRLCVKPFLPALCPVYIRDNIFFKTASGVRVKAKLYLYIDGTQWDEEEGEVQITDYGLSGIPIFQLSRHVSIALHEKRKVEIKMDILPMYPDTWKYLKHRFEKTNFSNVKDFGLGLVNQKLWTAILKRAKISENTALFSQNDAQSANTVLKDSKKKNKSSDFLLKELAEALDSLRFLISHTADFEKAQICTGGIDRSEIDFQTLELKKARGIHVTGEMIDVDGICGGYNLTWAWCSGIFAARKAIHNDQN